MRFNLWRVLAVFALCFIVSCGGGGGGGPSGVTAEQEVTVATEEILNSASNPDGAFSAFARATERVYAENSDSNVAARKVTTSWLAAVRDGADFQALWFSTLNMENGVSSQAVVSDNCLAGGTVFWVNGIMNPPEDAENGRQRFFQALRSRNSNTPACALRLFYNKSGLVDGSIQIFCQVFGLAGSLLFDWSQTHARTCVNGLGFTADLSESTAQWVMQVSHRPDLFDPQVVEFRQQIRDELAKGKVIFIVAHSQGNWFAQQAVDGLSLTDQRRVGILAIASPANYSNRGPYGSFRHYTLDSDAILVVPGALPANGSNYLSRLSAPNPFGVHSFIESYLGFPDSEQAILDLFDQIGGELAIGGVGGGGGFDETGGK